MNDEYIRKAVLIRVIDGDTIEALVDLGYRTYHKHLLRLDGIDTPEHSAGAEATAAIKEILGDAEYVWVRSRKNPDKYGRWLVTVYVEQDGSLIDVNQALLDRGVAVPYHGGRKPA